MISRSEERYYNDINSLASTMPRVVELLEKLIDNAKPVEPEPEKTDCQSPVKDVQICIFSKSKYHSSGCHGHYRDRCMARKLTLKEFLSQRRNRK